MSSVNFNIRMDQSLKERAFPIIERYGLTPAQAVKLFFNQIADTQTIPLSFDYHADKVPNATTLAAMQEVLDDEKNRTLPRYATYEEFMEAMQAQLAQ